MSAPTVKPKTTVKPKKSKRWEIVGEIGVDAGLCWLGDPCYCVTPDATEHPAKTWNEFCEKLDHAKRAQQWNYKIGHAGLGVTVTTGYGDGNYPVEVRYVDDPHMGRRVAEVRIRFIRIK